MPTFKFSKLVRDKIVDRQIASGAKSSFRRLKPDEHKQELINKIIEEAREILEANPDEVAGEIADVQQAIDDLTELCGLQKSDIAEAQAIKNEKNGAFKKGLYVDYVELKDGDEWMDYYRKHYPETE
jgi:predicted house-cleaning noncanonical NTP pyrophosphatase (MazG superfamily)